ncbi:tetratricopeptide (TPR) repeat protein [Salinibacter ruber]|uniref:tetratricopeptide repeat protein n=1 Tax=Salinibacter ruber TaxID=146919 RepID=UPI0021691206|nr:tetratricopeptide repeat protein [Salinibacter ruber]MCS3666371.1 tetratricopeptide (TPR) repeat protein [Salinibacter ruber]
MQWLTEKYLISPHLGRAILFGLLMLLPAVVLVTYRHGRPGPDQWRPLERWGTAANVLLALSVLGFAYGGSNLGSMMRTVRAGAPSVASGDATGGTSTEAVRQVPKKEFRKRVSLFYFDEAGQAGTNRAETEGAKADTSLRRTVANALYFDLGQDDFISTRFRSHSDDLQERNYQSGLGVPLALKREIARKEGSEYILSGTVGQAGGQFRLTTQLYETETGRRLASRSFKGPSLFPLVDQATRQLKRDLGLPKAHRENAADLPVTQVFTPSLEAARHYSKGAHLESMYEEFEKSARSFRKAAGADSTFALALIEGGSSLWAMGKKEKARSAFRQAKRHNYRLTKSEKYSLEAMLSRWVENDPKSALRTCERWTKLHPYDLEGWKLKGEIHESQLEYDLALGSYRRASKLSPGNKSLQKNVGRLLLSAGQVQKAVGYLSGLSSKYPEDGGVKMLLGLARWRSGQMELAEREFQGGIQADPQGLGGPDGGGSVFLAMLHEATGRFEKALDRLKEAVRSGESNRGSGYRLWRHHRLRGEIERSIALYDSMRTAGTKRPKFHRYNLGVRACEYYSGLGKEKLVQRALSDMQSLHKTFSGTIPSYQAMTHTGLAACLVAADSLDAARRHIDAADSIAKETRRPSMRKRYRIDYFRGRLYQAAGQLGKAVESYRKHLRGIGSLAIRGRPPRLQLALSQQNLGEEEEARKTYQAALRIRPAHPRVNYRYGRFLIEQGRGEKARKPLSLALDGWAPADTSFAPKRRAQVLIDSLDAKRS